MSQSSRHNHNSSRNTSYIIQTPNLSSPPKNINTKISNLILNSPKSKNTILDITDPKLQVKLSDYIANYDSSTESSDISSENDDFNADNQSDHDHMNSSFEQKSSNKNFSSRRTSSTANTKVAQNAMTKNMNKFFKALDLGISEVSNSSSSSSDEDEQTLNIETPRNSRHKMIKNTKNHETTSVKSVASAATATTFSDQFQAPEKNTTDPIDKFIKNQHKEAFLIENIISMTTMKQQQELLENSFNFEAEKSILNNNFNSPHITRQKSQNSSKIYQKIVNFEREIKDIREIDAAPDLYGTEFCSVDYEVLEDIRSQKSCSQKSENYDQEKSSHKLLQALENLKIQEEKWKVEAEKEKKREENIERFNQLLEKVHQIQSRIMSDNTDSQLSKIFTPAINSINSKLKITKENLAQIDLIIIKNLEQEVDQISIKFDEQVAKIKLIEENNKKAEEEKNRQAEEVRLKRLEAERLKKEKELEEEKKKLLEEKKLQEENQTKTSVG